VRGARQSNRECEGKTWTTVTPTEPAPCPVRPAPGSPFLPIFQVHANAKIGREQPPQQHRRPRKRTRTVVAHRLKFPLGRLVVN